MTEENNSMKCDDCGRFMNRKESSRHDEKWECENCGFVKYGDGKRLSQEKLTDY